MKKLYPFLTGFVSLLFLANYSSEKTTVDGKQKNKINISGTLETRQTDELGNAKQYAVDNIAIGKVYEGIPVFALPAPTDYVEKAGKMHLNKDKNPVELFVKTNIDLVSNGNKLDVAEIRVDNPEKIWVYKKKKHTTPIEYIEIIFVFNDEAKTEEKYMINIRQKLTCDDVSDGTPKEMEVPLQAIRSLKIKGFAHRDGQKCVCEPTKSKTKEEQDEAEITSEILEDLPEKTRVGIGEFPQGHTQGEVLRPTSLSPFSQTQPYER